MYMFAYQKKKKKSIVDKQTMSNTNTNTTPTENGDLENTFLRNNLRKKSYAEAILDAIMLETVYGEEEHEMDEDGNNDTVDIETRCNNVDQLREVDRLNEESWEINVSAKLK